MLNRSLIAALAMLASCAVAQSDVAAEMIKLSMAHPSQALHLLPIMVAEDRGFFAAEGLEVKNTFMAGGSPAAAAMMGGSVDAASGAVTRAVLLRAKGLDVTLLVGLAGIRDWAITVDAKRHAGVGSVKALKGLKIATSRRGSDGEQITRWIVEDAGLEVGGAGVSLIQIGGYDNHLIAIQKGDVDGAMLPEPFVTMGVQKGVVKRVVDLLQGDGPEILRKRIWTGIMVKGEFMKQRPEAAAKLTRAVAKAIRAIYQDPQMAVDVAAKHMPSVDRKLLNEMIPRLLKVKSGKAYVTAITPEAISAENEWLSKTGELKGKIEYDSVVAKSMSKYW